MIRSLTSLSRINQVQFTIDGELVSNMNDVSGFDSLMRYDYYYISEEENNYYEDRRAYADHSDPVNKLTPEERQKVIETVKEKRFSSIPPHEIVPYWLF